MMPPQHLGIFQEKAEKIGKPLEVAVVIGVDPFIMIPAATSIPYGEDELQLAGALKGEPIELVKCETIDVMVPANAEIVIEGEVPPNVREPEGPWADLMGYYIPVTQNHVFIAKAITRRRDAIYYTIPGPSMDDLTLCGLAREAKILKMVKAAIPAVKAVAVTPITLNCFISIKKMSEGEAKNAMMAAFAADPWIKCCTVVDDDVNVLDPGEIWWAIATRARLDKGLSLISDAFGFGRDPYRLYHMKLGIDATRPLDVPKEEFERARVPGEEKIRLDEYLNAR